MYFPFGSEHKLQIALRLSLLTLLITFPLKIFITITYPFSVPQTINFKSDIGKWIDRIDASDANISLLQTPVLIYQRRKVLSLDDVATYCKFLENSIH